MLGRPAFDSRQTILFSLLHRVQAGTDAQPASCPMYRGVFRLRGGEEVTVTMKVTSAEFKNDEVILYLLPTSTVQSGPNSADMGAEEHLLIS
jgi:hypothetical protein